MPERIRVDHLQITRGARLDHCGIQVNAHDVADSYFSEQFKPFAAPTAEVECVGRNLSGLNKRQKDLQAFCDHRAIAAELVFESEVERVYVSGAWRASCGFTLSFCVGSWLAALFK